MEHVHAVDYRAIDQTTSQLTNQLSIQRTHPFVLGPNAFLDFVIPRPNNLQTPSAPKNSKIVNSG